MEDKIKIVLEKYKKQNLTIDSAAEILLSLFNVSKRYSLDYLDGNGIEQKVKLWAESEDKALDKLGETEPKATYIFISKI